MSAEHPAFVCAREGHDPVLRVTRVRGAEGVTSISRCKRCGKYVETPANKRPVPYQGAGDEPAGEPA